MTSCIMDQYQVKGAVPVTGPHVEVMLRRVMKELMGRLQRMVDVSRGRLVLSEDPVGNLEPCIGIL